MSAHVLLSDGLVEKIATALEQAGDSRALREENPALSARCSSLSIVMKLAPDHLRIEHYVKGMQL